MWLVNLLAAFGALVLVIGVAVWIVAWILQTNTKDM